MAFTDKLSGGLEPSRAFRERQLDARRDRYAFESKATFVFVFNKFCGAFFK